MYNRPTRIILFLFPLLAIIAMSNFLIARADHLSDATATPVPTATQFIYIENSITVGNIGVTIAIIAIGIIILLFFIYSLVLKMLKK